MESKAELHDVCDFLGHANITTTSRYLRSAPTRLVDALTRLEVHQRQGFLEKIVQTSHKTAELPNAGAAPDQK
jgi:site-specific recombinase XerD